MYIFISQQKSMYNSELFSIIQKTSTNNKMKKKLVIYRNSKTNFRDTSTVLILNECVHKSHLYVARLKHIRN